MKTSSDVIILGGGPAGAAAALGLASRGIEVAVLQTLNGPSRKTLETLPPPARPFLEQLGLWQALFSDGHQPVYGNRSLWGSESVQETSYVFHPHGHGWRLDRSRFDARMRSHALERGTRWYDGCGATEAAKTRDGWELSWRRNGDSGRLKARFLVDATGRRAWLAQQHGAQRVHGDRLVAFACRVKLEAAGNPAATLVEAVEHGWWFSMDLPESGEREAVLFTDHDLPAARLAATRQGWRKLLSQAPQTSSGAAPGEPAEPPKVLGSRCGVLDHAAGEGWLAVGDAALTVDPLASDGLVTALKSGLEAAAVIADQLEQPSRKGENSYARRVRMNYETLSMLQIAHYRMESRWPSAPFWARRQQLQTHSPAAAR